VRRWTAADVSPPENAALHSRGVHLCGSRRALEASHCRRRRRTLQRYNNITTTSWKYLRNTR